MILSHFDFETPLELSSSSPLVLVVEDEEKFYGYCKSLVLEAQGESCGFSLFEGDKNLSFSKSMTVIDDIFSFSANDKKIITKLYQQLQQIVGNELLMEYTEIQSAICNLLDHLNAESDCPLAFDPEGGAIALFKAYGVCYEEEADSLLKKLISFLHVEASLLKIKCLVFINLKTFLKKEELEILYHEAELDDVSFLLMENMPREKLKNETIRIIDRDLCEIIA